jgi:hypothetical protein
MYIKKMNKKAFTSAAAAKPPAKRPEKKMTEKIMEEKMKKKLLQERKNDIINMANTEFKQDINGQKQDIDFELPNDLQFEKKICNDLIQLIREWESLYVDFNPDANASVIYMQSHGLEKVIHTIEQQQDPNTIMKYVEDTYRLKKQQMDDLDNFIQTRIKISSKVPSGKCAILVEPEPPLLNSDTIEHELYTMYMESYNNTGKKATTEGLYLLFTVLRLRMRKFFERLHEIKDRMPHGSTLTEIYFNNDTWGLVKGSKEQVSKEYDTYLGIYTNNKQLIFQPNPGEIDNGKYGMHFFDYKNGNMESSYNLLGIPLRHDTWLDYLLNMFGTLQIQGEKRTIINLVKETLNRTKQLTLADIFILGWAIGKDLFIFDPSCNAIQDNTIKTVTRSSIYPTVIPSNVRVGFTGNRLYNSDNAVDTQPTPQPTPQASQDGSQLWGLGGKKRKTKCRKTSKKPKKQKKKRTRRARPSFSS